MPRIGVISAYPDDDWHAQRIVAAARAVGDVDVLSPLDFSADVDGASARLLVGGRPHEGFDLFLTARSLADEGDTELELELYRTLAEDGALLVNDTRALTDAIDKFKTSWLLARAGLPTPRALVAQRRDEAVRALRLLGGRAVAKPLYGSLGIGVTLVEDEAAVERCLDGWRAVYLQAYVPGAARGDLRAFVVGDSVAAAIRRVPPPGEFRTNVHLGGAAEPVRLDERAARLAVAATRALGLDYAGVDLVVGDDGPTVLEVNGTPLFRGIHDATGRDMAEPIVAHALARAAARRGRRGARTPATTATGEPWPRAMTSGEA